MPEEEYVTYEVLLPADLVEWLEEKAEELGVSPEELLSNIVREMLDNKDKVDKAMELFKKAAELEDELFKTYKQIMKLYGLKNYAELSELEMKLLIFAAATIPPDEMRKIIEQRKER